MRAIWLIFRALVAVAELFLANLAGLLVAQVAHFQEFTFAHRLP